MIINLIDNSNSNKLDINLYKLNIKTIDNTYQLITINQQKIEDNFTIVDSNLYITNKEQPTITIQS